MAEDNEISLEAAMAESMNELSTPAEAVKPEPTETEENTKPETVEETIAPDSDEKITQEDEEVKTETEQKPAIQPPVSWAADKKQIWAELPPEAQEYISRRESERDKYLQEKSVQLKQEYSAIDSAFAGIEPDLSLKGLSKPQAIQELVSLYKHAERDPVGYIQMFAQSIGLDLQKLASGQIDPVQVQARTALQEINQLKAELNQIKNGQQEETNSYLEQEVARFASDPQNKFFEQVKADMALLFENGKVTDIPQAYEMACRMNPEVFEAIQKEKSLLAAKEKDKKAQVAKKAAGVNLNTREVSAVSRAKSDSLEDSIREAMEELSGGVAA